jgi:hypothetical protein
VASSYLKSFIGLALALLARDVLLDILIRLLNIASDIESVARSLGDGETVVKSDTGGNDTETDQSAPHLVNGNLALVRRAALRVRCSLLELALEASYKTDHDNTTAELSKTLHGEHSTHHSATPLGGSKFGGDDGRKRVVTTDTWGTLEDDRKHRSGRKHTDTHEDTPENDESNDRSSGAGTNKSLSESGDDDEDELQTVHLLSSHDVGQSSKAKLSNDGSRRGRQLDSRVLLSRKLALVVHDAQHDGQE